MYRVVEIHEARQSRHAIPLHGLATCKTRAYRFQYGRLRPDFGVTVHAHLRRRDAGKRGVLNGRVTVPAIDTVVGDMVLVRKRHRLIDRLADIRHVWRANVQLQDNEQQSESQERSTECESRETRCSWTEYLRHTVLFLPYQSARS